MKEQKLNSKNPEILIFQQMISATKQTIFEVGVYLKYNSHFPRSDKSNAQLSGCKVHT